jgi:hypothetical protein
VKLCRHRGASVLQSMSRNKLQLQTGQQRARLEVTLQATARPAAPSGRGQGTGCLESTSAVVQDIAGLFLCCCISTNSEGGVQPTSVKGGAVPRSEGVKIDD